MLERCNVVLRQREREGAVAAVVDYRETEEFKIYVIGIVGQCSVYACIHRDIHAFMYMRELIILSHYYYCQAYPL